MRTAFAIIAAFLTRDWRIAVSYRLPFALEGGAVGVQLVIAYFIGRAVGRAPGVDPSLDQGYFAFAAIGVAALGVLQTGLIAFGARLRQEQTAGTLEILLASPAPASLVVLANGGYELLRESLLAVATIVLAVVLFGLQLELSPIRVMAAGGAFAGELLLVGAVGVTVAAFGIVYKQAAVASAAAATLLAVLTGVWFPVSVLPAPLDSIAAALPFTWGLDALRDCLLGGSVRALPIAGVVGVGVVAFAGALRVLGGALRRGRRRGSLGLY